MMLFSRDVMDFLEGKALHHALHFNVVENHQWFGTK